MPATTTTKRDRKTGDNFKRRQRVHFRLTKLRKMDAYWRASNYLSVGQIYLLDNPLLKEPLKREHIKPRLLGHWGTSPGLNMLYVHLNRVIKRDDLNMIYVIGPGHGGPSSGRARLLWRAPIARSIPTSAKTPTGCGSYSSNLASRGGFPAMSPPKPREASTRVASWDMRSAMPTEQHSTTPT